ncbi:MAG: type IV pilus twitching motility protein PilT [Candidatus Methylacidiphilales bacterium]
MSSAAYNDYVLQSSVDAGWITPEQQQIVLQALERLPGAGALELMAEQGILPPEHVQTFRDLIAQAETTHVAPESDPVAYEATHHLPVTVSEDNLRSVDDYLRLGMESHASDVHLGPDAPPMKRQFGLLQPLFEGASPLSRAESERLARSFLSPSQVKQVETIGSIDFCYEVPGLARFRSSVVRQRRGWESVFRVINSRVPTMDELGLPPVLHQLIKYHNGLILVTGPVGCGKSTTLAALIQQINHERHDHIITLEDPIEYVQTPTNSQISQREVHTHTESFAKALRASLREDPDVIMVGEMRDLETVSLAITASETGHLVLGTLHTSTAARTLDRLLDVFPIQQQAQIRTMVSESIRGIICQQLVPRADGQGRVLALEIMVNNPAIANLIREAKTFMLPGIMQTGRKQGMRLMDDSLMELLDAHLITAEEAYQRSENKKIFAAALAARHA